MTDLDDNPRIADDPTTLNSGDCVDMGVYEFPAGAAADGDGDGVPDSCDLCPGFDDFLDSNADGTADGCDACPGFDDGEDSDGDGVADGCEVCPGFNDALDGGGVPDGCDTPTVHNLTQLTDHFTLQAAIDASTDGDVIAAEPGTYQEAIKFNGKAITLRSASGDPTDTIIDGNGAFHVVQCVDGEGLDTVLEGFTITGGNANSTVEPNDRRGAGMYIGFGSPTVRHCLFIGNAASSAGGGMFDSGSSLISDCIFRNNSAFFGGGIFNSSNTSTVTKCIFSGNIASQGGGMANNDDSSPVISNSIFSSNSDQGRVDESAQIFTLSGTPVVNYGYVQGGWSGAGGVGNIIPGPLNDPGFVDPNGLDDLLGTEDDNLRLRSDSPVIDAGDGSVAASIWTATGALSMLR